MNRYFHMDEDLFDIWIDTLIHKSYDWKKIGISNEYCNQISEPEYGLRIISWQDRAFEVIDENKLVVFLLRYR